MNALKQEFPSGFEVLGFPCNEFYMVSSFYTLCHIQSCDSFIIPSSKLIREVLSLRIKGNIRKKIISGVTVAVFSKTLKWLFTVDCQ